MSRRIAPFFFPLFWSLLFLIPFAHAQQPFRFIVVGDTGSGSPAQQRVSNQMWTWMQDHPLKVVLMLGDNIYGNHEISGGGNPRFFHDKFDLQYERFEQKGVVFHAAVGNHDMQTNHAQAEIDDVRRFGILGPDGYYKFSTPAEYDVEGRPLVEFFCINSELKREKLTAQNEWLGKALDESKAVWKIVYLHHPLYTVHGQHDPAVELREMIRPALERNHVQIILAGHNHFYARMKPVHGALQVISGGGGRHLAFPLNDNCATLSARKYHFVGVEAYPKKIQFTAIDQYGARFDEVVVDEQMLKQETKGCPKR